MSAKQFRILYREFLFRIVDRELLSTYARGDMSQLLLQIATVMIFLSLCFALPALRFLTMDRSGPITAGLWFEWSIQHFVIATTMLIVGLLAVLSWRSMFPDHRDVLVLAPLPIRAHTILLAKLSAVATTMALAAGTLHAVAGVAWPIALNSVTEARTVQAFTSDAAMPPVDAARLEAVLDDDFAQVRRTGPLAAGAGGALAIGISQRGVSRVLTYGAATRESIFEIGSVTKVFTALALARMADEGLVRLEQPLRRLVLTTRLAEPVGPEITLLDLATHHSGLPPLPWNLRPRDPANPYADYDVTQLYRFLEPRGVGRDSSEPFVYSNLGYGLLAHALTLRADTDYPTLIAQSVTGPLGLRDTVVRLSSGQASRFLQGYNDRRRPVRPWDTGVFAGAGALRSTVPDLLAWLDANLHPERFPEMRRAIELSHQIHAPRSADRSMALGWMVDKASGAFQHGGAVAGFTSDVYFNPREDLALAVLSNTGPASAVSADVVANHIRARLAGTPAVAIAEIVLPARGGVRGWMRLVAAYWFTMVAAAVFMFGMAIAIQGLSAALLPHRVFLRASSFLQLGAFCLIVAVYFLQPMGVNPMSIVEAQRHGFRTSPSFWFLGLFQTVSGSPALASLARPAWIGLAAALAGTIVAYALAYLRTLRRLAEEPDITPAAARLRWLPRFGGAVPTAIVQFSLRTLSRSAQHRVLIAFYWGIGFALTALLLKTPRAQQLATEGGAAWDEGSVPYIVSSLWMMACAVLAARVAFSLPRDLPANGIFRTMPLSGVSHCVTARRRAFMVVAVLPVWAGSAVFFLRAWPLGPAISHLAILALIGLILVEVSLRGARKIPFTCSYLPGRSRLHIAVYVAIGLLVPLTFTATQFERTILQSSALSTSTLALLAVAWIAVRWRAARTNASDASAPDFEDEPPERILTLEVWDSLPSRN